MRKLLIAASALGLAFLCYKEVGTLRRQQNQIVQLEQQAKSDRTEIRGLIAERDQALARAGRLENERSTAATGSEAEIDASAREISAKASLLKSLLARVPDQRIPEMRLLNPDDWDSVVLHNPLQDENDFRKALADLRGTAKEHFAQRMRTALDSYLAASQKQLPADITELASYFNAPVDADMLSRYEVTSVPSFGSNSPGIRDKLSAIVDDTYDTLIHVGLDGGIGTSSVNGDMTISLAYAMSDATAAFQAANGGAKVSDPAQLVPFFKNPADGQRYLQLVAKNRR